MSEFYLKVFVDRSELMHEDGSSETFLEGAPSSAAVARYNAIRQALTDGFLEDQINLCRTSPAALQTDLLSVQQQALLNRLVSAITSEVGRALVGVTILQLCVKAIIPEQSIRLHKSGSPGKNFSWREGISMRSLDKGFITPVLRRHDLLKVNADGVMMTRTLAENYPYSKVYKANFRGAKREWTAIVEEIERGTMPPLPALQYTILQLINRAEAFVRLASQALDSLKLFLGARGPIGKREAAQLILKHIDSSDNAARLMEISMHALMQALGETDAFIDWELAPLSQMRSANKKHGNIGDIELLSSGEIVEAWDAKYGKTYLRDELEELEDKLSAHSGVMVAGFVTSGEIDRLDELKARISEIEEAHGVEVRLLRYSDWLDEKFEYGEAIGVSEEALAASWLTAYVETLAQKRREIAPVDEPCYNWLESLNNLLLVAAHQKPAGLA